MLLVVTNVGYTYYCHCPCERHLPSAVDKGAVADVNLDWFVKRPSISRTISSVLYPAAGHNCYHLIIRYHRASKTSLSRNVSIKLDSIMYVDILRGATSLERFALLLGTALKWSTPRLYWVEVMCGKIGITQEDIHGKDLFSYFTLIVIYY